jgi:hypothetical protein
MEILLVNPINHHKAARQCCRCRKDLTDAASLEVGIGPICRKQSNTLLAKSFNSDVPAALAKMVTIDALELHPESVKTFSACCVALASNLTGTDWREQIKQIEYVLSFSTNRKIAGKALGEVAELLGYDGIAALWRGEASTGATKVYVHGTRLIVEGPQNGYARQAFLRSKEGAQQLNRTATTPWKRSVWSLPINAVSTFAKIVRRYYPMAEGIDELVNVTVPAMQAAQPTFATPPAPTAQPPATPVTLSVPAMQPSTPHVVSAGAPMTQNLRIEKKGILAMITTPYNAQFIGELKVLVPYKCRSWDAASKKWVVDTSYVDGVVALIHKVYGKAPMVMDVDALGADPAGLAKHLPTPVTGSLAGAVAASKAPQPPQSKSEVVAKIAAAQGAAVMKPNAPTYPKPTVLPF